MERQHTYNAVVKWTGNTGTGTANYKKYERSHSVFVDNKPPVLCSSDPAFRGDKTKYNPEELLVASLSSCHMLWYLHLCSVDGVVVIDYVDKATGTMIETAEGGGHFSEVVLNPVVVIENFSDIKKANELHQKAHELCFIANSVNFKVHHNPTCLTNES